MQSATPNALIHTNSPYLQQHAYNPVQWMPWGEEALEKARTENKMLLISIGYAACHWCHVMERESFEDETVAHWMNTYFVPVKVDREERPDVDQLYMSAAYLTSGRAGWPLNAFALPDGRPFFAGTYFPRDQWVHILSHFSNAFAQQPHELQKIAERIVHGIQTIDNEALQWQPQSFSRETVEALTQHILEYVDFKKGGLDKAPRFPMPNVFRFLLRQYSLAPTESLKKALEVTLNNMMEGGIYDQVGGGFARYSTDEYWFAPHFEKMLYDNAQLISLYAEAYAQFKNPYWLRVAEQTLAFCKRELQGAEGLFYSALDADSEGVEGKFYTWSEAEIDQILKADAAPFKRYFSVTAQGNWEGTNILYVGEHLHEMAEAYHLSVSEFDDWMQTCLQKLFVVRAQRIRPTLDDKCLAAWNGLMLEAICDLARYTQHDSYTLEAEQLAHAIETYMLQPDGSLKRNVKDGVAQINAFLDDYACVIQGFLSTYSLTQNEYWLQKALHLTEYAQAQFFDTESGYYFYTSHADTPLVTRTRELSDNVIPASNSMMARNILQLSIYFDRPDWHVQAREMAAKIVPQLQKQGVYHTNWGQLMQQLVYPSYELVLTGPQALQWLFEIQTRFLPLHTVAATTSLHSELLLFENRMNASQTRAFICQEKACGLPISSLDELLLQI